MATGWITTGGLYHSPWPGKNKIFNADASWPEEYPLAYGWQAFNYNIKGFVEHTNNNTSVNNLEYLTQTNNDTFEFISPEVSY